MVNALAASLRVQWLACKTFRMTLRSSSRTACRVNFFREIGPSRFRSGLKYSWSRATRSLVITSDLVARDQEYFNPDLNLDGPISLKKLTRQAVRELERKVILKVLQANHWTRKEAASALTISYRAPLSTIRD